MKTTEYRGFSHVFKFTFRQTLLEKSFRISFLVMLLLVILVPFIMNYFKGTSHRSSEKNTIEKAYVINESGLDYLHYETLFQEEGHKLTLEETKESPEQIEKKISKDKEKAVIFTISFNEEQNSYDINLLKDGKSGVDAQEAEALAQEFSGWFEENKISALDAGEDSRQMLKKRVSYERMDSDDYLGINQKEVISKGDYGVVYFFLMLFYLITVMAAGQVAGKVAEEKSNRVVEYLMTSVRPRALILGKVASLLLLTVGELALIVGAGLLSNDISAEMFGCAEKNVLSSILSPAALEHLTPINGILCFVVLALGIFIYGMIAGLFGASVSRIEDLAAGLRIYNVIIIAAFLISMTAAQTMWTSGIGGIVAFCLICPFTSVMLLPGALMIGKVSFAMAAGSFVLQLVTAVVVMKIVETVYERIIVMNGNVITIAQMADIFKKGRKNEGK